MKKAEPGYPFIPSFVKKDALGGGFAEIRSLEHNPNWIVKEFAWVLDEDFKQYLYRSERSEDEPLPPMTFNRFKAEVAQHKEIIDHDPTNFRRYIPENALIYGTNDQGEERGFIAMKAVKGIEIEQLNSITTEQVSMIEEVLLAALAFYEANKHQNEAGLTLSYFPDLIQTPHQNTEYYELHNIMFGRLAEAPEDTPESVYMIDTYPLYVILEGRDNFFQNLSEAVHRFEDRFGTRLKRVDDALANYT